jgi:Leucine-rich repeat (LRR) protein
MTCSFVKGLQYRHHTRICCAAALLLTLAISGCSQDTPDNDSQSAPPVKVAKPSDTPLVITPSELRHQLRANEKAQFRKVGNDIVEAVLFDSGVKSIEPLQGLPIRSLDLGHCKDISDISALKDMPLRSLILENTSVSDISILKGMSLEVLYLQNTPVTDIRPIEGMPIRELNLMNVPISDLTIISTLPLKTLWLPGTKVSDISALQGKSLESLDLEGTAVQNFDVLATLNSLKRLNIADTAITDVSILKDLHLDRIAISPEKVTSGMEHLRDMPSLTQFWISNGIGQAPQQFSSTEFWERYDLGIWNKSAADNTAQPEAQPAPAPNNKQDDPVPDTPDSDPSAASEDNPTSPETEK